MQFWRWAIGGSACLAVVLAGTSSARAGAIDESAAGATVSQEELEELPPPREMWRIIQEMQGQMQDLRGTVHQQQQVIDRQQAELAEREIVEVDGGEFGPPVTYPTTTVGGYADLEFSNFDNTDSAFDQHRLVVNVASQLHERISFYSEIEFEHGGEEVEVEQAWLDFELHPWLVFRAGALLMPFGRYNLYHDSDLVDLTARPLFARRIVPTTWTEAGAGFHGDVELPRDAFLDYEVYFVNGLGDGISPTGTRDARASLEDDNNNDKAVVGRVSVTPWEWLTVGVSGYHGRWTSSHHGMGAPSAALSSEDVSGYALDLFARRGPFELIAEYGGFDFDGADRLAPFPGGLMLDGTMRGGYIQGAYHFWPPVLDGTSFGEPYDHPTFTLVGRAEWAEVGLEAPFDDNEQTRYILGLNYRPIEPVVFKIEYHWNDTDGDGDPLEDNGEDGFLASAAIGF